MRGRGPECPNGNPGYRRIAARDGSTFNSWSWSGACSLEAGCSAKARVDVCSLRCRGRYYCILSRVAASNLSQCEEDLITIRSDNIRPLNISSSGMSNEQEISFRARGSHRRANIPQLTAERPRPVLTPEYLGGRASSLRVGEQDIGIGRKERAFVCQVLTGL